MCRSDPNSTLISMRDHSRMLVQVCESLAEPQTRKREITALSEAMSELGLTTGTIVTRNENERVDVPSGIIQVTPVWRFLLELPESTE